MHLATNWWCVRALEAIVPRRCLHLRFIGRISRQTTQQPCSQHFVQRAFRFTLLRDFLSQAVSSVVCVCVKYLSITHSAARLERDSLFLLNARLFVTLEKKMVLMVGAVGCGVVPNVPGKGWRFLQSSDNVTLYFLL